MPNSLPIVPIKGQALFPAAYTPNPTYHGGPLLTNVEVCPIFWGTGWLQSPQNGVIQPLNDFFNFILTSPLLDFLGEYSVPGQPIGFGQLGNTTVITDSDPGTANPDGSRVVTDSQIQQALQDWINALRIPQPGSNTLFFVYLPPNVTVQAFNTSSCVGFCGYHNKGPTTNVTYAVEPYLACSVCNPFSTFDNLTLTSSHELCEAITDPIPGSGWVDDNVQSGEIGDFCAWQKTQLGSYTIQTEWSNKAQSCVAVPQYQPLTQIRFVVGTGDDDLGGGGGSSATADILDLYGNTLFTVTLRTKNEPK